MNSDQPFAIVIEIESGDAAGEDGIPVSAKGMVVQHPDGFFTDEENSFNAIIGLGSDQTVVVYADDVEVEIA